jgi:hypothetical protein
MKVIQPCPECGGTDLRIVRVDARDGYGGPNLLPGIGGVLLGGQFDVCICAACGLTRLFVPPELVPEVRKKYAALPVVAPPTVEP